MNSLRYVTLQVRRNVWHREKERAGEREIWTTVQLGRSHEPNTTLFLWAFIVCYSCFFYRANYCLRKCSPLRNVLLIWFSEYIDYKRILLIQLIIFYCQLIDRTHFYDIDFANGKFIYQCHSDWTPWVYPIRAKFHLRVQFLSASWLMFDFVL